MSDLVREFDRAAGRSQDFEPAAAFFLGERTVLFFPGDSVGYRVDVVASGEEVRSREVCRGAVQAYRGEDCFVAAVFGSTGEITPG